MKFQKLLYAKRRQVSAAMACIALLSHSIMFSELAVVSAQNRLDKTAVKKKANKNKRKREQSTPSYVLAGVTSAAPRTVVTDEKVSSLVIPAQPTKNSARSASTAQVQDNFGAIEATPIAANETVLVDFRQLSVKKASGPKSTVRGGTQFDLKPAPGTTTERESAPSESLNSESPVDSGGPFIPSPAPSTNFQGEFDEAVGGGPSGTFTIPPDTMGAVGLTKVVSILNNNIVVHDKATGARLSVASLDSFWASTGATSTFDPRIIYDPYNNRWIVAAVSNALTANASVLVGLSQTSDPQGTYSVFRFVVGCAAGAGGCNANGEWADFPMLGFNKNWVAVSWNQFTINTQSFITGRSILLDYPTLRTGTANGTQFTIGGAFCFNPATTFSATEANLYFVTHLSSGGATYVLGTATGTPAAPSISLSATKTRPGGGWTQPSGDALPQTCIGTVGVTCPATPRQFDSSDAFVRSNVVFRNGNIWYPQTIALPAGGLTTNSRFAAQWTRIDTSGNFVEGGRIEDPTATRTNGGEHYAFPSISVNKNNDVLVGFSNFESDDLADAGYAYRLGTDAPGTMRDPIIYKEGEDYYSKAFGGTRNRWGDYSNTVIDPVNDRDLWTIQEYAQPRTVQDASATTNNSRWGTWWAKVSAPAGAGDLLISEFRLRGPGGANDEFVEIYNPNSSPLTVSTVDGSSGYALVASDGVARFTIPNGTVIPANGHYLGVDSTAYSLGSYPAGNGTTATGDATFTTDIPDNAGIALFQTSNPANFTLANRIDAVGSTAEANTLYKEGTGYSALTPFSINYSFYRSNCPGNTGVFGTAMGCTAGSGGFPKDTDNNANDFVFVDTNGTSAGAGQRLGAPGPENLSSPIIRNSIGVTVIDPAVGASSAPNRVRDFTSDPANNSTFGTLSIRRTITNTTGASVTRLRFRVIDLNTFPSPSGFADLRPRTSSSFVVGITGPNAACPGNVCAISALTLEQPPTQINGGGFNSSLSAGTVTLGTPLAAGATINVSFLLGIQQTGNFRFYLNVEALP